MSHYIEATTLDNIGLTVGYIHIPGTGFRVATRGGGDHHTPHMSIAGARRLANQISGEPELQPAVDLLNAKADRLEAWLEGRDEDEALAAQFDVDGSA